MFDELLEGMRVKFIIKSLQITHCSVLHLKESAKRYFGQ